MSRKSKKTAIAPRVPAAPDSLILDVTSADPAEQAKQIAGAMLKPSVKAGVTIMTWGLRPFAVGITELVSELSKQGALASDGDLSRLESMLAIQAHTLDAVFNEMARLAKLNIREHLSAAETFMRLGLKAQSQCRATIETLAAVKNPPNVAFVKQSNYAAGHQQVNNGQAPRGNQFQQNELLEKPHEQLEHRTTRATGFSDPKVATLGAIDRTKDARRQDAIEPEQQKARRRIA